MRNEKGGYAGGCAGYLAMMILALFASPADAAYPPNL